MSGSVGYKQPPKGTRFKVGQSGNPGGRPKNVPSFSEDLRAELAEEVTFNDGTRALRFSKQRALLRTTLQAALTGDARATSTIIALAQALPAGSNNTPTAADEALVEEYFEREVKDKESDGK